MADEDWFARTMKSRAGSCRKSRMQLEARAVQMRRLELRASAATRCTRRRSRSRPMKRRRAAGHSGTSSGGRGAAGVGRGGEHGMHTGARAISHAAWGKKSHTLDVSVTGQRGVLRTSLCTVSNRFSVTSDFLSYLKSPGLMKWLPAPPHV